MAFAVRPGNTAAEETNDAVEDSSFDYINIEVRPYFVHRMKPSLDSMIAIIAFSGFGASRCNPSSDASACLYCFGLFNVISQKLWCRFCCKLRSLHQINSN